MNHLIAMLSFLTARRTFPAIAGAALGCHAIFNRLEPSRPLVHAYLLLGIPGLLTFFLAPPNQNVIVSTAVILTLYLSITSLSIVVYRLSPFHPLARYPGPTLGKISAFWIGRIGLGGKEHIYHQKLHDKYGDIVRTGPNSLSIRDPAAIAPMMGPTGMPQGPFLTARNPNGGTPPMISLRDPVEHSRRRRPWNRAFNTEALKGYEEIIEARANQLLDHLAKQDGVVDLSKWLSYFTYDFMSDMAFGGGSEMMRDGDIGGIWHLLEGSLPIATVVGLVPWMAPYIRMLPIGKTRKAFGAFTRERAAKRLKEGSQRKDLFYHLIDEGGIEPTPPTPQEVESDGMLAIVAGSDTTSTALSNIFWYLLQNPRCYNRLRKEVDALGNDLVNTAQHARMHYLNAVINEALRLLPPVPSGSHRATVESGKMIGPYFIPENTTAVIHFYSLHRDPRNFSPTPAAFLPERWLSSEEQITLEPTIFLNRDAVIHNTSAFIPFSFGPAICVGRNLALQEMRMVICLMMQRFDMRFSPSYDPVDWEEDLEDFFIFKKGVLPIILSPRKI